jgi:pyrimidine operon attenuation protein/uracil phosphoribosyltransferase
LAQKLKDIVQDRVGTLDITLYRDDLSEVGATTVVRPTEVDFDIAGLNVVLVDDVIQTGRSARSALEAISDLGRPRRVWFCVLVDRGGRELPIQPDIVGLDLSSDKQLSGGATSDKSVFVQLTPTDPQDQILIDTRPEKR